MKAGIGGQSISSEGVAFNSLMGLIEWGDSFKLNQPVIDSQHQRIFDLASQVYALSGDSSKIERLTKIFEEFGTVVEEHFRHEESVLADIRFPRLEEHRAEHNALLSQLEFIRKRLASEVSFWTDIEKALVILNFMLGVTVGHILRSDIDYVRFMQRGPGNRSKK